MSKQIKNDAPAEGMKIPKRREKVLVVDNDKDYQVSLANELQKRECLVTCAGSAQEGWQRYAEGTYSFVLTDLVMETNSVEDGLGLLKKIMDHDRDALVIVLSGAGAVKDLQRAQRLGAYHYLDKSFDYEDNLVLLLNKVMAELPVRRARKLKDKEEEVRYQLIGRSPAFNKMKENIEKVARADANTLITGKSGSGKELVARAIQRKSPRSQKPFVIVDIPALKKSFIESELFGHKKNAFTDAEERVGLCELADGGTIFLDEIGELSLDLQAKLLRFAQEGEVRRIGSNESVRVDVRIISATHRDLPKMISQGLFREDLYHRLDTLTIELPSLSERAEDIRLLLDHYLQLKHANAKTFSPEALEYLETWSWSNNIRELRNFIERVIAMSSGPLITLEETREYLGKPADKGSIMNKAGFFAPWQAASQKFRDEYVLYAYEKCGYSVAETGKLTGYSHSQLSALLARLRENNQDRPSQSSAATKHASKTATNSKDPAAAAMCQEP